MKPWVHGRRRVAWVFVGLAAIACNAPAERRPQEPMNDEPRISGGDCVTHVRDAGVVELRKGSEVWGVLCTPCHGEAGQGGVSGALRGIQPPDLTDPARAASYGVGERIRLITEGVPGTTMVGWKSVLTEGEIQAVYRHVCTLMEERSERGGE